MDAANIYTVENFIKGVEALTVFGVEKQDSKLVFTERPWMPSARSDENAKIGEIPLHEITDLCDEASQYEYIFEDSALYSDTSYEVAVRSEDPMPFNSPNKTAYCTSKHDYSFTISNLSKEFLVSLIFCFGTDKSLKIPYKGRRSLLDCPVFETLEKFLGKFGLHTAKINSPKQRLPEEYKKMLNSYIFNLTNKFDTSFSLIDLFKERKRYRPQQTRRSGQLFPCKSYNSELTSYYYQAVAASFPSTKYLDFYHVIEYFFQSVSKDEAYEEIQNAITRPSFSPHSKEDVGDFYEMIREKMQKQHEDGVWKEKPALLLCLKKYVPDLGTLKKSIEDIDADAVPYYQTTAVPFVDGGTTIDFTADKDKVYKSIRDRVYSVRNAIVHSKEGSMLRYEPFKHNEDLAKEIPLIRAIAEECIIQSAEPINYHTEE